MRLITTLFKSARAQRYAPKDHHELEAVEGADDYDRDIEIFTPIEPTKLFAARAAKFLERGKERTRME